MGNFDINNFNNSMKNEAEDLFKVSFGDEAEEEARRVLGKENVPEQNDSNPALDFVDDKIIGNQLVPEFGKNITYAKLFKLYQEGESLPREIDNVVKFKKWFKENNDNTPTNPIRRAA